MKIEARIAELGIELPPPGSPKGSYALASRCGNLVLLSGHLPARGGDLIKGKVGKDISVEDAKEAARLVGLNLISTLKAELGDLDKVAKIQKLDAFVNCTDDFESHPAVVNGCSDLMFEVFGEAGRHSRSAVGANSLPLNVPIEIDAVVQLKEGS
ncbi:hypothetical protein CTAYLR_008576 [Chrysophaeum taylorii]|uniref:Endoribonuclease L-PSP/chorismate mutase-like domain-containing protein n=1 Tax=Chrysophaeum taylorii TaxID=2483200 RepID=A0AAD7UEU1_9STRA|nr:hypothetical protein CTAYLR_008576 [Chrysophaeum taylorii]